MQEALRVLLLDTDEKKQEQQDQYSRGNVNDKLKLDSAYSYMKQLANGLALPLNRLCEDKKCRIVTPSIEKMCGECQDWIIHCVDLHCRALGAKRYYHKGVPHKGVPPLTLPEEGVVRGQNPVLYFESLLNFENEEARTESIRDINQIFSSIFATSETTGIAIYHKALSSDDMDWIHFVLFIMLLSNDFVYQLFYSKAIDGGVRLRKFCLLAEKHMFQLIIGAKPITTPPSSSIESVIDKTKGLDYQTRQLVWFLRQSY